MVIIGEKGISSIVKRMLDVIFIGGIFIYLSLPLCLKWYLQMMNEIYSKKSYYFLLILLYTTGFFALTIVYELRKIFKTLNRRNPFMMDNVKSFNHMGIAAFIISFCYFLNIIFFNSFLNSFFTIIICMVFVIAGFFCIILAEVFHQAIIMKEENDFTI
jgi:hypothetical protein